MLLRRKTTMTTMLQPALRKERTMPYSEIQPQAAYVLPILPIRVVTRRLPWFTLTIQSGIPGFEQSDELKDKFIDAFVEAGEPADMAVFVRHDQQSGLSTHWFSPATGRLAFVCHATACSAPTDDPSLKLFIGDECAHDVLFRHDGAAAV